MKILVCVKQVPDTNEVKIDPVKGTLIRDGVPSILNPDDANALEAALQLKDKNPDVKVVVVEPASSAVLSTGVAGPHKIQGIGAGFVPDVLDTKIYDEIIPVSNDDAFATGKEIGKNEGVLVGISSGAALWAAIELAKRPENKGKTIVGSKTKDLLILTEEMEKAAGNLYITTDDGSFGIKGMVTGVIEDLVEKQGRKYDVCVAIGPMIMMKFVCLLTKKLEIPTIVSLNPIMVDGTGMCGACRVTVGDQVKFACVDGPEFDGHLVNFDEAMERQRIYKTQEGRAMLRLKEGDTHLCHFLRNFFQINDVVIFFPLRHIVKLCPRQRRTIRKDRIARIRHQNHIALVHDRKCDVRQSLLGTKQRADLRLRIQFHPIAALIPVRHCLQERLLILNCIQVILRHQAGIAERF